MKKSEFNKIKREIIYYLDRGFTVNEYFDYLWGVIDDKQKEKMSAIKDKDQELLDLFNSTVTREKRSDRSRCMAVHGITLKPQYVSNK